MGFRHLTSLGASANPAKLLTSCWQRDVRDPSPALLPGARHMDAVVQTGAVLLVLQLNSMPPVRNRTEPSASCLEPFPESPILSSNSIRENGRVLHFK